jgi:outer membrane protein assembly factor BamD (BamD/ComL family)
MNQRFILLIFAFILSSNFTTAGKIEKGFKSLEVYNYFDAKNKFENKFKKSTISPAAFGLATIYFRQDNPFHNIDSAYNLIRVSEATFSNLKEKKALKYLEYGFSIASIANLKDQISAYYFDQLTNKNTINEWNRFISRNPEYGNIKTAKYIRDSLAFGKAKSVNTTRALTEFLETYPNSELKENALEAFYMAEYREQTMSGTVLSYEKFIENFSSNPHVSQAQDQIYNLTTKDNTVEALNTFIKKYPDNRNKEDAWRRLYQVYMYEYSDERIEQFETEFPNYPFNQELKTDLQFSRLNLFPFRVFNKFGAMDVDGEIKIPPTYESMGLFSEGLAMVGRDGKLGFINKQNELIIPCMYNSAYDFEQGRAIV